MYQKRIVSAPLCKAVENQRCGAAYIYTCSSTTWCCFEQIGQVNLANRDQLPGDLSA
jgi:hypothetical protein